MTLVHFMFRDSALRRDALRAEPGAPIRYSLYGLDELAASGFEVRHNLERTGPPAAWARVAGGALKRALEAGGGYGGDFATVLESLRTANRADVVFSTVDTVGIPLVLLRRARLLRVPLVYAAIGLPERLERLRGDRMCRLYAQALGGVTSIVAYSEHETRVLRTWLERFEVATRVAFVPFGVDADAFAPVADAPDLDVVSIGADTHRDYELLLRVAAANAATRILLVTTAETARTLPPVPANVTVEVDLPFEDVRERLTRARVVALPVRENSYSGATTVLLQAMASGKPVVVTRTQAIASGYELVDGGNCRLVPPGDAAAFGAALADVLDDDTRARVLGAAARETVLESLTWAQYARRIEEILRGAAARRAAALRAPGSPRG
jgi:glycosyltransferase involved in cell wall biosynthesis